MGSEYPFETLYFVQFTYRFFRLAGFFNWPDVRESEFQNPLNSCLCSVKSSKFVLRKSKSWSWNPEYSSGNPESDYRINDWNPESKFLWQRIKNPESRTWNPESTAWSPESKAVLDSLIWRNPVDLINYWFNCISFRVSQSEMTNVTCVQL